MKKLWGIVCLVLICLALAGVRQTVQKTGKTKEEQEVAVQESQSIRKENRIEDASLQKRAALTFDDGPSPVWTPRLLDGLQARGIRATFFLIGQSAEQYPEIVSRMYEEGHIIGNHSYHHVELPVISFGMMCSEITAANQVILSITGEQPRYLRPPYGSWKKEMECPEQLLPVLWDIDSLDWKLLNTVQIVERVLSEVKDGDIILMHDIYETSVEAALQIADALREEGYQLVTVEELIFDP